MVWVVESLRNFGGSCEERGLYLRAKGGRPEETRIVKIITFSYFPKPF